MYLDAYHVIRMEQNEMPGAVGDSCAETGRYAHLKMLLSEYEVLSEVDLTVFITDKGYIRHPEVPEDWKEKDFSGDQAVPLYLAFARAGMAQGHEMRQRLKSNGYKTGNGDYISIGFFAKLKELQWLQNLSTLAQGLIFKLPYRYSESKKGLEKTEGSSADYLNWLHLAVYTPKWLRKIVSKDTLKQKVREYYKPEPNPIVIELYDRVLERYW